MINKNVLMVFRKIIRSGTKRTLLLSPGLILCCSLTDDRSRYTYYTLLVPNRGTIKART